MKIVVFGLTISSSWGNGHATLWRGLCRALAALGHDVTFFEKDVPYYAAQRDLHELPYGELVLYSSWDDVRRRAEQKLAEADVGIVTSYCPDGIGATEAVLSSRVTAKVFYDLDTPVTLSAWAARQPLSYVGARGFDGFDLVLSFTGGAAITALRTELRARRVEPLFGHVDPSMHHAVAPEPQFTGALSYLGTYSADRQAGVVDLFIAPARASGSLRFVLGGASYPAEVSWPDNVVLFPHVPPPQHPAFFCSSRLTLSVTRNTMARLGYCPSGRLFEAAACGAAVLSDDWEGLDKFFEPGKEILIVRSTEDVLDALQLSDAEVRRIAEAGRARVLAEHTAAHRAGELERILARLGSRRAARPEHIETSGVA
ncbi:MAG TPA: glycosyltransferase [Polyangiaceae bacterium]|nr:glycosyltransferase [Polyangiaceae bacterium]